MVILIRGGGDLGSGVALRLFRAGLQVVITELPDPRAVRQGVAFASAVYTGETRVEDVRALRIEDSKNITQILQVLNLGAIPVVIDETEDTIEKLNPLILVDARMLKSYIPRISSKVKLLVGLGPGFKAGENCDAVIETNRGHTLGRVIWHGSAQSDTKKPEGVEGKVAERVLRAPSAGYIKPRVQIGEHLDEGQVIAELNGQLIRAPFQGVLRGLVHANLFVKAGMKIGDVDPRNNPEYCWLVSDKSLAIGGGVLEAILSRPDLRSQLWC